MDSGQQLTRVEWLAQIVICPDFKAVDAVHILHFGRQHDDRSFDSCSAQTAANAQTVFARQHQVEHHQVDGFPLQDPVEGATIFGQQDVKTLLRQITAQQVTDAGVVIDDDDFVQA